MSICNCIVHTSVTTSHFCWYLFKYTNGVISWIRVYLFLTMRPLASPFLFLIFPLLVHLISYAFIQAILIEHQLCTSFWLSHLMRVSSLKQNHHSELLWRLQTMCWPIFAFRELLEIQRIFPRKDKIHLTPERNWLVKKVGTAGWDKGYFIGLRKVK